MLSTTVQMIVEIHAKPEHLGDLEDLAGIFAENTRAEPGCARMEIYRRTDEPHVIVVFAEFENQQGLEAHLDAQWRQAFLLEARDWIEGPPRRFTMQRFA